MLFNFIFSLNLLVSLCAAATIHGKFDFSIGNLTKNAIRRTTFKLYQIGNYTTNAPYKATTNLVDLNGNFAFEDVPINAGVNETTYFVLYSSSLDYNLAPNRVLIEFTTLENGTYEMNGFRNFFGREYFPSPNITHPDKLEPITVEPYVSIRVFQNAPYRSYFQVRNSGMFQDGPIASIVNSKWKLAAVITVLCMFAFPMFLDKIDPDTAATLKAENLRKKKEQYVIQA
ncbi:Sop4 protein [Maudiozyma humilis]|uniref:Protein SOP4 n=1 Tax=Maudiozyma humilis TaxID=51915 RepID=A0AAV5RUP0_MAUHU|nr:Sop4 protein [Kazachstania humilis]